MGDFSIALPGLEANSAALNGRQDNLADIKTAAYKDRMTSFENLAHRRCGDPGPGDPIQIEKSTRGLINNSWRFVSCIQRDLRSKSMWQ
ncbi:hypothetical protein [Tunturiibacter gelidiferens]|uniref:Uncharacterized protein n=1 Tax=Tunturiibacter gelidiferens TaxID=3069689 RepID=A0AAU7Z0W0_9BACT